MFPDLDEKKEFFRELQDLDDGLADECLNESVQRLQSFRALPTKSTVMSNPNEESALVPKQGFHTDQEESQVRGGDRLDELAMPSLLARSDATAHESSTRDRLATLAAIPRSVGKRKRPGIVPAPENQRIFCGLAFYFFPNNDTNVARRMRINKAIEYGATWIKDWCEDVTHVIMDSAMTLELLLKYLNMASMPPKVVVVTENYPADCISSKLLLNPSQSQYLVRGIGLNKANLSQCLQSSTPFVSNVQGKLDKSEKSGARQQTPSKTSSKTSESSQESLKSKAVPNPPPYLQNITETGAILTCNDSLAEVIEEAKNWKDLPLELEDLETGTSSCSDGETDHEDIRPKKAKKMSRTGSTASRTWQDNSQCMQAHTGQINEDNPNARTIEILSYMGKYYTQIRDEWRAISYRKAITSLRKHPVKVATKEEAERLPFIGKRLAAKIEEIVWTNKLRRLENAYADPIDNILQTFMEIYGVGFRQASKWVNQGFKTFDDLLTKAHLTENQRVGIEHFDDFQARIPRYEVEQHGLIFRKALQKIDREFQVTIMGSYRRGAEHSGDIDLLITKPNASHEQIRMIVMQNLLPLLFSQKFFKVVLAVGHSGSSTKWMGASALPGSPIWRRIDLLLIPEEQMGAAQLYFTGNDIFNRSIRLLASRKGMRLNQRGLFVDVIRGKGRTKINEGRLLEARSEKRIFQILGVPWRPPNHRNC